MRGQTRSKRARGHGFTLIEVLVSMGLMAIIGASLFQGFTTQSRYNTLSQERNRAAAAAQVVMDEYRLEDPAELPESGEQEETVEVGGHDYAVTTEFCADATYCTSERIKHLRVTVERSGEVLFRADTVYSQLR